MDQAATTLQQKIYRLDPQLDYLEVEWLALMGLTPIACPKTGQKVSENRTPKPKTTKRRKPKFIGLGRKVYWHNGISAAEAKGPDPSSLYQGKLCPGGLLWPSDIADYYAAQQEIRRAA